MQKNKSILITTPIYYPSGKRHIGTFHTSVLADFYARAFSLLEYEVFLSTGTDEHGDKVYNYAISNSKEIDDSHEIVMNFLNEEYLQFKKLANDSYVKYDRFIRTTHEDHEKAVKIIWNVLLKKGFIYKDIYEGFYSYREERFIPTNELEKYKDEVVSLKSECYFLRISEFRDFIIDLYENNNVSNQLNLYKAYMNFDNLCISRNNTKWGIDVPNDSTQKIYVWFDALINYLTVIGFPVMKKYNKTLHIIGKDISIFHGIYWPIILHMLNIEVKNRYLLVHNWWLDNNENKVSKSFKNSKTIQELIDSYGVDAIRFFVIFHNLTHCDMIFQEENIVNTYNNFLVNKFSNLVHRIFSIIYKNNLYIMCNENHQLPINFIEQLESSIEKYDLRSYVNILFKWCDTLNEYIETNRVWNDLDKCLMIAEEINLLYKYFIPIIPSLKDKGKHKPLFIHIQLQ